MPVGSRKPFRDQMRCSLIIQALAQAMPTPVPIRIISDTQPSVISVPTTNITSYIPTPLSALGDIASLSAQGLINGYSFFSNIRNKNSLVREKITSASISLICMAQLGLAMYYFFANVDCTTEDSAVCKTSLCLSALKIGLLVFAAAGSELIKLPYAEERAIREREAAERAAERNEPDPFLPGNMQLNFAPVLGTGVVVPPVPIVQPLQPWRIAP